MVTPAWIHPGQLFPCGKCARQKQRGRHCASAGRRKRWGVFPIAGLEKHVATGDGLRLLPTAWHRRSPAFPAPQTSPEAGAKRA